MSGVLVWTAPDLFGQCRAVGVEWADGLRVSEIQKAQADEIIREGHYSHSVVWSSSKHFGVFVRGRLIGALQYGPAMNPRSGDKIVAGTTVDTFLELNRMWLALVKPPNTASRAISGSLRLLRKWTPALEWVQSFADERCGKLGAVYQACSFLYLGSHEATFYEIEGQWFHKSILNRPEYDKRGWWRGPKATWFNANKDRATQYSFRQFRYVRLLRPSLRSKLLLPVMPYPKPALLTEAA